jgi:5'-3' exonuclease
MARRRVHLVDASPYIFRAFFSMPDLEAPDGSPVGAVHGFASFLIRYVREEEPTHLGVAYDESLTTSFRNDLYPDYKARRELPPPDLEAQQKWCQDVARAMGAATYVDRTYEADDLIGTLVHQLVRKGHQVVVVSSDKDLSQLVSDDVELFDFAKGARCGPRDVFEKLGVRPGQVADFLGLAGDAVDNIPGVRGVGSKTAAALLAECGDLDRLYADLDRVAELPIRGARTLGARLEAGRESAFLSRELATIATDAPVVARLDELRHRGADRAAAEELFARLGFERIAERIPRWAPSRS